MNNQIKRPMFPASAETPCYTVLDLFSGIGGFSLGLERTGGFKTVAFCEIDQDCRAVLGKHWPGTPIFTDVREVKNVTADVVCGGFPCQPFSSINTRGRKGEEHAGYLWPEMLRVIAETRPAWVLGENVLRLKHMALDTIQNDLEEIGYESRAFVVPACAIGSPQLRERVFVVAHSQSQRKPRAVETGKGEAATDARSWRHTDRRPVRNDPASADCGRRGEWPPYTGVCRVAPGLPGRVDKARIRQLGNTVLPGITEIFGRMLLSV